MLTSSYITINSIYDAKFLHKKLRILIFKLVKNIAHLLQMDGVVPRAGFERAQNDDVTKKSPFLFNFDVNNQVFLQISP